MTPTPRAAAALALLAASALLLPLPLVAFGVAALVAAGVVDARAARRRPEAERELPEVLSRGVPAPLHARVDAPGAGGVLIRQAAPPDLGIRPQEGPGRLEARVVAKRRGRHALPDLAARVDGPLGLGRSHHRLAGERETLVYPDLPAARRMVVAVRQGRFREDVGVARGPLGLGTELESVRDYLPDDDIRQLNWRATARLGRPMSNQYRVERERDVICLVDTGRLMAAPLGADATRLDAALDAATAVALVAEDVGDRCGAVAFDDEVRRLLRPRRRGADTVVRGLFDIEPRPVDSDYGLAFRTVEAMKRGLLILFTDILEESAAEPLLNTLPVLARRHAVVVASAADPELDTAISTPPEAVEDVYAQTVALDVLEGRARVVTRLRHSGCEVVEAPPARLPAACVSAYLSQKRRARL